MLQNSLAVKQQVKMEKFQLYLANTKRSVCSVRMSLQVHVRVCMIFSQPCCNVARPPPRSPFLPSPHHVEHSLSPPQDVDYSAHSCSPRRSVQAVLWLRFPNSSSHLPKSASCLLLHYLFAAHRSWKAASIATATRLARSLPSSSSAATSPAASTATCIIIRSFVFPRSCVTWRQRLLLLLLPKVPPKPNQSGPQNGPDDGRCSEAVR